MRPFVNKLLLFSMSIMLMLTEGSSARNVSAMLAAVCVSALCSCLEGRKAVLLSCIYCGAACIAEPLRFFLPLILYDSIDREADGWKRFRPCMICLIPVLCEAGRGVSEAMLRNIIFCLTALIIGEYENQSVRMMQRYIGMRDETREKALSLETRNRELREKQDYEVQLATLRERNRIAREIHDNVGHLLTRSIFQVSALQVVYAENEGLNQQLILVRQTLSDAMDNIRNSVHNLHEESIDLRQQLNLLTQQFTFCPVRLSYDAGVLPGEVKYMVIAVVKEALSNVARHSNATEAKVSFLEHPGFYQLIISDNGSRRDQKRQAGGDGRGIGLQNMEERVRALGGVVRIDEKGGYRVFITVPRTRKGTGSDME